MFKQLDFSKIKTRSIAERKNRVSVDACARPFDPFRDGFGDFVESLPSVLKAADLRALAAEIAADRKRGKPVILLMGAHVV